MHMLMNSQPAVAFGVIAGGLKSAGGLGQLLLQLGVGGVKTHGEGTDCQRRHSADLTIMAGPDRQRTCPPPRSGTLLGLLTVALLGFSLGHPPQARAQSLSPNQPEAIRVRGIPPPPCPLLVPLKDAALQPLRIAPNQVAKKNSMGCLSPADAALYGPDGCPVKLCRLPEGTVPMNQR